MGGARRPEPPGGSGQLLGDAGGENGPGRAAGLRGGAALPRTARMIPPVRLFDTLVARTLPATPRPVVRRFADRYMAGERLSDAVSTVKRLNSRGAAATVDVLGEFVTHPSQAEEMVRQYLALLDAIRDNGLDSHVSIKLTALGLEIDPALARENLVPI